MSTKKRYLMDGLWKTLYDMMLRYQRGVSAGEVARERGVARSTAVRWLTEMVSEGGARAENVQGKNHLAMTLYAPLVVGIEEDADDYRVMENDNA